MTDEWSDVLTGACLAGAQLGWRGADCQMAKVLMDESPILRAVVNRAFRAAAILKAKTVGERLRTIYAEVLLVDETEPDSQFLTLKVIAFQQGLTHEATRSLSRTDAFRLRHTPNIRLNIEVALMAVLDRAGEKICTPPSLPSYEALGIERRQLGQWLQKASELLSARWALSGDELAL